MLQTNAAQDITERVLIWGCLRHIENNSGALTQRILQNCAFFLPLGLDRFLALHLPAMAASRPASVEADDESKSNLEACPILTEWQKSSVIMGRVTQTSLVQIPLKTLKIKREHLSDNVDLLGPLINNLGILVQLRVYMHYYIVSCLQLLFGTMFSSAQVSALPCIPSLSISEGSMWGAGHFI